eukprot:s863_g45.t1
MVLPSQKSSDLYPAVTEAFTLKSRKQISSDLVLAMVSSARYLLWIVAANMLPSSVSMRLGARNVKLRPARNPPCCKPGPGRCQNQKSHCHLRQRNVPCQRMACGQWFRSQG